jgi:hypothetical protein
MRKLAACVILLCPSLCVAGQRLEITPTLSFRQGGDFTVEERAFYHETFSLDISTSETFGLRLAIPISQRVAVELLASQQKSELEDEQGLFGEQPGGFYAVGQTGVTDLDVTYYHAGIVWDLGQSDIRGFLVGSAGVTRIEPDLPLDSDTPFSASVGGGVQFDLSEHLGLLFEGRIYWSDTDPTISATDQFEHRDCIAPCSYTYRYPSDLTQLELTFGLVIKP